VRDAIEGLPEEFRGALENVAIVVKDEPDRPDLSRFQLEAEEGELFGLYHGVPLAERGSGYIGLPDRIEIYRGPILRSFDTPHDIVTEIRNTVIHELGHHMGLSDEDMPY
jgi:predicted Zn-dependent protease with MMP-like domain